MQGFFFSSPNRSLCDIRTSAPTIHQTYESSMCAEAPRAQPWHRGLTLSQNPGRANCVIMKGKFTPSLLWPLWLLQLDGMKCSCLGRTWNDWKSDTWTFFSRGVFSNYTVCKFSSVGAQRRSRTWWWCLIRKLSGLVYSSDSNAAASMLLFL